MGNVRINITWRRVRLTTAAVEKQTIWHIQIDCL